MLGTEEVAQASKLVAEFQAASKLYFEGRETYNSRKQDKGLKTAIRVVKALDALGSGHRAALVPLLESGDVEVIAMAANFLIKIVPERALAIMREIDAKGSGPTSMFVMTQLFAYNLGEDIGMGRPQGKP
jgi:hypothetical protein